MYIGNKKLLPIKELVGRTKYTRDYIAKLARDGEVVGVQVGRQWFVDEVSLQRFIEASELELTVRRRHLSQERKREREVKQELKNQWDVVAAHPRYAPRRGVVQTLAIMVCGIFSGYALYTLPVMLVPVPMLQKAQAPLSESVSDRLLVGVAATYTLPISSTVIERVTFADTHEARHFSSSTQGVLVLPLAGILDTEADIAMLFSDPVDVAYDAAGVGEVRLQGVGDQHVVVPFVTVPVQVGSEDLRSVMLETL